MTGPVAPPPPARAPLGSTATVRSRLLRQHGRPWLVSAWAALFGELGLAGPPARRRAGRFLLRSLPAAVVVLLGALLALRAFDVPALRWPQALALGGLAAALGAVVWRRAAGAAAGRRAGYREQLELGALFVVAALALVQATAQGAAEPALQPIVYLVMAFLVAFLARPVGLALVLFAAGLEAAAFWLAGARPAELPALVAHAGFLALFALLVHAVLAAQVAASRRAEEGAVAARLAEIEERAREFRLLGPGSGGGDAADRSRRAVEAAVVEIESAVRGVLEVAEVALGSHTCAVFLLSDDDQRLLLREVRTRSDAVGAEPLPAGEGALGGAVRRRAAVRLHGDVKAASYYLDGTRPGALLAVPLTDRQGGHVRGVVVADRLEDLPFTDQEERLLVTLAAEILRAVAAERLMEGIKSSRDEWEQFFQALERLNKATKLADVLDATLAEARRLAPACFGAVTLVEQAEGKRVHRVARTWSGPDWKGPTPPEGLCFGDDAAGLVASAVRLEASLPAREIDAARAVVFDAATRLRGLSAVKVVPLRAEPLEAHQPAVLGTLVLGSARPGAFDRERLRQLEMVALQAGESIRRAGLFDATERLATTDGLTGLTNHRTFQARLDEHLQTARRYGRRVSLLLCDIDHFKGVNDTHGHPVGDQVLRGVARTLAREARTTDVVARYGGEEFAVVMPETDGKGALVIAERIRERVGALVTSTEKGPLRVTMSLGVACFPDDAADKAQLVERADGSLYHAKRSGRNQSVSAARLGPAARRAGA